MELNLYRVKLRGMQSSSTGICYGLSFVVATDPTNAYDQVSRFLDDNDIGFYKDRELDSITLLASTGRYNNTGSLLFIPGVKEEKENE